MRTYRVFDETARVVHAIAATPEAAAEVYAATDADGWTDGVYTEGEPAVIHVETDRGERHTYRVSARLEPVWDVEEVRPE